MQTRGRISYDIVEPKWCFIKKNYPEFARKVDTEFEQILPPFKFKDYALIPNFIEEYCNYRGVNKEELIGANLSSEYTRYRKEFLMVLLLCYHPEKIYGYTEKRTQEGIQIAGSAFLACNPKSLSNFIPDAPLWFQTYSDFKEPVEAVHAIILEKFKHHTGKGNYKKGVAFTRQSQQLDMFQ